MAQNTLMDRDDVLCEDATSCESCPMMCREFIGAHVAAQNYNSRKTRINRLLPEELRVRAPIHIPDPFKDFFQEENQCDFQQGTSCGTLAETFAFNA